ncbi:Lysophospholipase L1 [Amycolatopsis xylanica]|uniref:Lysophospholipase L1 n=1 Tax=Amycolatopsis xylanica TaxID=589385 RepID=A0A1H2T3T1_9PSEU|nr:GDSL-type esterase/lipase family protein [Amycolatopsis xylanica]SDW38365.1 Lysophospholipase L1 [Amycolatopsis xylanica]
MFLRRLGALLAVACLALATPAVAAARQIVVYAAPNGVGPLCAAMLPCSVTTAQQRARQLSRYADVVVRLAGGTYSLTAPLVFGAEDSGVRWQAAPGQKPVFSGGLPVTGWRESGGLWSARVPADLRTRQLYADGVRLPRAQGEVPMKQTPAGFDSPAMASWRNPSSIEFVLGDGHGSWSEPRCGVASIQGSAVTMRQPCWDNMKLADQPRGPFGDNPAGGFPTYPSDAVPSRVENAFELLSPGEWYLDEAQHVVYYQPKPGENVRSMHFVAPKLEQLMRTSTSAAAPLHDMTFEGIEFAYATWLRPSGDDGFVEMQANFTLTGPGASKSQGLCEYSVPKGTCPFASWTRPDAAVDLTGTRDVSFVRNTFTHLGGAGLGLQHGVQRDLIEGNVVTDVSGIGILLGAVDDPRPATEAEIATGNTIRNNLLRHTGVEFTGAPAIVNGYSRGTSIVHNEIGDVPYTGISSGWGGWRTNSVFPGENPNINADNTISNNLVYRDMLVRYDGGAVYTNGPQGTSYEHGLTVTGNVNFSGKKTANTVYNDEGGDYVTITGNVQYDDGGGFNGGCSTTGHVRLKDNYHVGPLNSFPCAPAPVGLEDLGGNRLISPNPQAGEIPAEVLAAAGLEPAFRDLTTSRPPVLVLVSPSCTGDLLLSGSGFTPDSAVTVGGKSVPPVYVSPNHLTVSAPAGGTVTVSTASGTSSAVASSLCAGLSTRFDNVGITRDGDTSRGNVDGYGYSYSAEALAAKGVTPGALISSHGIKFTWPTGSPDNAISRGQLVGVSGASDTLGFLLASTSGTLDTQGMGRVQYTDGSNQDFTIGSPNWEGTPSVVPVVSMPYRNGPGGRDNRPVHVFFAVVKLDPHKTVKTVRLPDSPKLHIFSVGLAGSPDLALGKIATQSSEAWGGLASHAVDGDTNGVFGYNSVSHTDLEAHPWWQVDLGAVGPMSTVNVWNRTDCCSERLNDYWLFVSAHPFDTSLTPEQQAARPGVWSQRLSGSASVPLSVTGRYVMVQLARRDYLSLAEVQVFGTPAADEGWVGTWGTAPAAGGESRAGQSVRNIVHTSVAGTSARVTLSNKFGTSPLLLSASVALRAGQAADAVPGSLRRLTFAGRATVTVPAGQDVRSDPLDFAVPADGDLLVTTYTPSSGPATYHPAASQTSFAGTGDHVGDVSGAAFGWQVGSWFYVKEIDVRGSAASASVLAFGDSITDGGYSTSSANHRWPDYLADRLGQRFGVLNSGISANRLLLDGGELAYGRSGLSRVDDDALDRTAVRTVILLEGINDMLQDPRQNDPAKFAAGYRALVDRLHAKGIRVIGATITPFKGWWGWDTGLEATRTAVNEFIRTSGIFDGVVDFAAAIADSQDPLRMKPEYSAEDKLHPSDAGNEALAAAIDLGSL